MGEDKGIQSDRVEISHPPIPVVPGVYVKGWRIDDIHRSQVPSDLVAGSGKAGARTEWDASSLDSAIDWLETHAEFVNRLSYKMVDIQDAMGGAATPGAVSPLGSFDSAQRLAAKHASFYISTEDAVRRLSQNLYNAAEALRKVKENYETAEQANVMSAEDMVQIFADVARNDHP